MDFAMDYDYLEHSWRAIWQAVLEMAEGLCNEFRQAFAFLEKLSSQKLLKIRRRRLFRPKNQRLRVLFLDRRRKTYHCRNACAADYW